MCVSHGFQNEHNLSQDFVTRLIATDETKAQDVLEYIANQRRRIWDPMQIFSISIIKGSTLRSKIPHYCAYVRSATVTPTTVYFNTPNVDTSNRIIRQYSECPDRLLRVRFTDEKSQVSVKVICISANPTNLCRAVFSLQTKTPWMRASLASIAP